jgi:hypothetical protein
MHRRSRIDRQRLWEPFSMRPLPFVVLPLVLLAGCVGQLRDFVGPVSNTTSPQLLRFGLDLPQARCVGTRLGDTLRPRQLRMFARAMSGVRDGWFEPGRLGLRDLAYLAAHSRDAAYAPALDRAIAACNVALPSPAASMENVTILGPGTLPPPQNAPTAATRPPTWLNLGAAGSGQSIAIKAATIDQAGSRRTAWFRLTDPGQPASPDTFLLEVDCAHRTINAKARERRDAAGTIAQHVDYPDNPLTVEGGTVMEIAWLSLCT